MECETYILTVILIVIFFLSAIVLVSTYCKSSKSKFTNITKGRIILCGLVRDSKTNVLGCLKSLQKIGRNFDDYRIIIVENNSIDGTDKICKNFASNDDKVMLFSKDIKFDSILPQHPDPKIEHEYAFSTRRYEKMAYLRNLYMDEISKLGWYNKDDYVIVADLDLKEIPVKDIMNGFSKLKNNDWNLVCANGIISGPCEKKNNIKRWGKDSSHFCSFKKGEKNYVYYDSLALILPGEKFVLSKSYIKDEKERELFNKQFKKKLEEHEFKAWNIFKSPTDKPVEVDSCFGGLSIYKSSAIKNIRYSGKQCEHVEFNKSIKNGKYNLPDMNVYYD